MMFRSLKIPASLLLTLSLLFTSLPAGFAADAGIQDVAGADHSPFDDKAKIALEAYHAWLGGEDVDPTSKTMDADTMAMLYKTAGGDAKAFKRIAFLIAEGKIHNGHSLEMARLRDGWIDDMILQMAKEKGYQIGRSDSGNQTSGMKSDLDQTFYVFKRGEDGIYERAPELDAEFIAEFNRRWNAHPRGVSLESMDLASIAGQNRFPDPRDQSVTEYYKEFERTTRELRATPGAYTYQGAVLQQMQFRALEAIFKQNPRAFRIYDAEGRRVPPDDAAAWTEDQWEEWRRTAIRQMFGIEPQLMKGHAFGASMANYVELQKYMDMSKKFESKYHLRTWEDGMFVLLLGSANEGRRAKREYADLAGEKKQRYNELILKRLFPKNEKMRRAHGLALDISADLRRLHKATDAEGLAKVQSFGGEAISDPAAQKRRLFGPLALEMMSAAEKAKYATLDKVPNEYVKRAEEHHRRLAREFCLESVYHTSIDAFEMLVDPRKSDQFIRRFNHLLGRERNLDKIGKEKAEVEKKIKALEDEVKKHRQQYDASREKLKDGRAGKKEVREHRRKRDRAARDVVRGQDAIREARREIAGLDAEKAEVEKFKRLTRGFDAEVTDANRAQFLSRLGESIHVSILYAVHDLGPERGQEMIRRLSERFPGADNEMRLGEIVRESQNLQRLQARLANADKFLLSPARLADVGHRVHEYFLSSMGIEYVPHARAVDHFVREQRLVWNWRKYVGGKMSDAGSFGILANILLSVVESEADVETVMKTVMHEIYLDLPVIGQIGNVAEGGVQSAAMIGMAFWYPPAAHFMLAYSLGSTAYAIYDMEFEQPAHTHMEDAVYRGFSGPELRSFGDILVPFTEAQEKELSRLQSEFDQLQTAFSSKIDRLWENERWLTSSGDQLAEEDPEQFVQLVAETKELKDAKADYDKEFQEYLAKIRELENWRENWNSYLKDRKAWAWQGGSYLNRFLLGVEDIASSLGWENLELAKNYTPGAALAQTPFEPSMLEAVPFKVGFLPSREGALDFGAAWDPAAGPARIKALEDAAANEPDLPARFRKAAEKDELELQRDRWERAQSFVNPPKPLSIELVHRIRRDSLYPYLTECAKTEAHCKDAETYAKWWLETNNNKAIDTFAARGQWAPPAYGIKHGDKFRIHSVGGIVDVPKQLPVDTEKLVERFKADYERSKNLWEEYQKAEQQRREAGEKSVDDAVARFRAQAVGMISEHELSSPVVADFSAALEMAAVQRSEPSISAQVYFEKVEGEGEDAGPKKEDKYDVGILVRVTADPTLYYPPYATHVQYLDRDGAAKVLASGKVGEHALLPGTAAKLRELLTGNPASPGEETIIPIVTVTAGSMADPKEMIFPETVSAEGAAKPAAGPAAATGLSALQQKILGGAGGTGVFGAPIAGTFILGQDAFLKNLEKGVEEAGPLEILGGGPRDDRYAEGGPEAMLQGYLRVRSDAIAEIREGDKLEFMVQWSLRPDKDKEWKDLNRGWTEVLLRPADWKAGERENARYRTVGGGLMERDQDDIILMPVSVLTDEDWRDGGKFWVRVGQAWNKNGKKSKPVWSAPLESTFNVQMIDHGTDSITKEKPYVKGYGTFHRGTAGLSWFSGGFGDKFFRDFYVGIGGENHASLLGGHPLEVTAPDLGTFRIWTNMNWPGWTSGNPEDTWFYYGPNPDVYQRPAAAPMHLITPLPGTTAAIRVSGAFGGRAYERTFNIEGPETTPYVQAVAETRRILHQALMAQAKEAPASGRPSSEISSESSRIWNEYSTAVRSCKDQGTGCGEVAPKFQRAADISTELTQALRAEENAKHEMTVQSMNAPRDPMFSSPERDKLARESAETAIRSYKSTRARRLLAPHVRLMANSFMMREWGNFRRHLLDFEQTREQFKQDLGTDYHQILSERIVGAGISLASEDDSYAVIEMVRAAGWILRDPLMFKKAMDLTQSWFDAFPHDSAKELPPDDYFMLAQIVAERWGDVEQAAGYWLKGEEVRHDPNSEHYRGNKRDPSKKLVLRPGWFPQKAGKPKKASDKLEKPEDYKEPEIPSIRLTEDAGPAASTAPAQAPPSAVAAVTTADAPPASSVSASASAPVAASGTPPAAASTQVPAAPTEASASAPSDADPDGMKAWGQADRALYTDRNYQKAVAQYKNFIQKNPGHPEALTRLAWAYELMGSSDWAVRSLEQAAAGNSDIPGLQSHIYNRLAMIHAASGAWEAAAEWNGKALAAEPNDAMSRSVEGTISLRGAGRSNQADAAFAAAALADPAIYARRHDEGIQFYNGGMFDKALLDFTAACHLKPNEPLHFYWRAKTLSRLDRRQEAVEAYRIYFSKDSHSPWAAKARYESGVLSGGGQVPDPRPVIQSRLGMDVEEITYHAVTANRLAYAYGAVVGKIDRGGWADKSGFRTGDVIQQVNGMTVMNSDDLAVILGRIPPHAPLQVQIVREGLLQTI